MKRLHLTKKSLIALLAGLLAIALIIAAAIIMQNSSHCHHLTGTWRLTNTEDTYIFTFNGTNAGTDNQNGTVYNFTYTDHGGVIELLYPDDEVSSSYAYQLSEDNNTLIIEDSLGTDIVYTCE